MGVNEIFEDKIKGRSDLIIRGWEQKCKVQIVTHQSIGGFFNTLWMQL